MSTHSCRLCTGERACVRAAHSPRPSTGLRGHRRQLQSTSLPELTAGHGGRCPTHPEVPQRQPDSQHCLLDSTNPTAAGAGEHPSARAGPAHWRRPAAPPASFPSRVTRGCAVPGGGKRRHSILPRGPRAHASPLPPRRAPAPTRVLRVCVCQSAAVPSFDVTL